MAVAVAMVTCSGNMALSRTPAYQGGSKDPLEIMESHSQFGTNLPEVREERPKERFAKVRDAG